MSSTVQLDLIGITWPVCLLKFKTVLNNLDSCEVMEVFAQDPEVVDNIVMIIERSEDTLIDRRKDGESYRLFVRRK
jgi:TusA-related sulfurtransferase